MTGTEYEETVKKWKLREKVGGFHFLFSANCAILFNVCIGCVGKELLASLRARGVGGPVRLCNLGDRFIPHGAVPELYRLAGLDARSLADAAWEVCQNEA